MDYEKKYNEALAIAKETYETQPVYRAWLEKMFPELRESEDERVRNGLIRVVSDIAGGWPFENHKITKKEAITYLEKQNHDGKKWITPAELNRLETLRYEAGYKAGFNVGVHSEAEKQKEHSMSAEEVLTRAGLKPYKDGNQWCILAGDNIQEGICGFGDTIDEALYQFLMEVLEKQKEHFRDDTKKVEKQDYSGLNDLERAFHRGFLVAGVENVSVTIIKETAKECLEQVKPAEWSEEDKDMLNSCISSIEEAKENRYAYKETDGDTPYDHEIAWLKSLRPVSKESLQPHWKPSEEQMDALKDIAYGTYQNGDGPALRELYEQLKKLI